VERNAKPQFSDQMLGQEKDKAFLIHFDREVELLQDLTPSREKLQAPLELLKSIGRERSTTPTTLLILAPAIPLPFGIGPLIMARSQLYDAVFWRRRLMKNSRAGRSPSFCRTAVDRQQDLLGKRDRVANVPTPSSTPSISQISPRDRNEGERAANGRAAAVGPGEEWGLPGGGWYPGAVEVAVVRGGQVIRKNRRADGKKFLSGCLDVTFLKFLKNNPS